MVAAGDVRIKGGALPGYDATTDPAYPDLVTRLMEL